MEQKWYQKDISKKWWFWAIMITAIIVFTICICTSKPSKENAKEQAQYYIEHCVEDLRAYSRKELIERLKRDGYSTQDSIYGADNCGADWNSQAVLKAGIYLNIDPNISDTALFDLLLDAGFTQEQATYGLRAKIYYN